MSGKRSLNEREIRSLISLLDDEENSESLGLVRKQILLIGGPILPYLEEAQSQEMSAPALAENARAMVEEIRFQSLKEAFLAWARTIPINLEEGAFLLCRFSYPGLDPAPYRDWLDQVAASVRDEIPSEAASYEAFQKINSHLFHRLGFSASESRYYDPDNAYLSRVVDTRRGMALSLGVLYLLICRRLKLKAFGVAAPGHFLVGFRDGRTPCFIDPVQNGRFLDFEEGRKLVVRSGYEFRPEFLSPAAPWSIILGLIRWLISIYRHSGSVKATRLSELVEFLLISRAPLRHRS